MQTRYYETTTGKQYRASLTYDRTNGNGIYTACIVPCEITSGDGYYTVRITVFGGEDREFRPLSVVSRRSKKTDAEAADLFTRAVLRFFETRGLVARMGTIEQLARPES